VILAKCSDGVDFYATPYLNIMCTVSSVATRQPAVDGGGGRIGIAALTWCPGWPKFLTRGNKRMDGYRPSAPSNQSGAWRAGRGMGGRALKNYSSNEFFLICSILTFQHTINFYEPPKANPLNIQRPFYS
jgi:hypothetical protein